jgi:tRNA modification GTPase
MYISDTIAAVATAPGQAGVAIIRVSGPDCRAIARRVFRPERALTEWTPNRLYHGAVVAGEGCALDEAMAVVMRAPRTYTGEDVLEIHCHGSPVVVRNVLALVLRNGARLADAGEFTKRAFLNGRIDLAQAEAVMDLVRARGDAAAAVAVAQLTGGLSRELAEIRDNLVQIKSFLEAQIDFSEEDVEIDASEVAQRLSSCTERLRKLIDSFKAGKVARDGLHVVIAGKPNVGKSSLLNALLQEDRAIVTDFPGTTRDTIQEAANFEGIPVALTDTAGLRALDRAESVERLGIQRSSVALAAAQVGLLVFDSSLPLDEEDRAILRLEAHAPRVLVLNKVDLPRGLDPAELGQLGRGWATVEVSAKTSEGLDRLRRTVLEVVNADIPLGLAAPILANARHHDVLRKTLNAVECARRTTAATGPPDVIAVDVQDALDFIGEITGAVTNEEVLDRIFSQFCIGK